MKNALEARLRKMWTKQFYFPSKNYCSHNLIHWHPLCSGSEKASGGVPGLPCLPDGNDWNERQNEDSQ